MTFATASRAATLFASVLTILSPLAAADDDDRIRLEFIGDAQIPSGFLFEETVVGGLSGIDYDTETGAYVAISDDRGAPRYYNLTIDLSDGWLMDGDVEITGVTSILDVGDVPFTAAPDPEGIRLLPFPGLIYWTSERAGSDTTPWTRIMTTDGRYVDEFDLPEKFVGVPGVSGTRNNLGFESLTFGRNERTVISANESALVQDGEPASLTEGAPARVLKQNNRTGEAGKEYIYWVDPIAEAPEPADGFADSGLVELLTLDRKWLLAMERSFAVGPAGYTIKLYLTTTKGATNVRRFDSIAGRHIRPMKKKLLLNLEDVGITPDNVEGMTFGPRVDGKRTLILVSDDNFSAFGPQVNQFVAFKILEEDE